MDEHVRLGLNELQIGEDTGDTALARTGRKRLVAAGFVSDKEIAGLRRQLAEDTDGKTAAANPDLEVERITADRQATTETADGDDHTKDDAGKDDAGSSGHDEAKAAAKTGPPAGRRTQGRATTA
jgi:hypothetical protein